MVVGKLLSQISVTATFLKQVFRSYYTEHGVKVAENIASLTDREFGFSQFERVGVRRHLCFKTKDELTKYLIREGPRDVYVSIAYYALPCEASSMEAKGWMGADLAFDIDADHVLSKGASISYGVCVKCSCAVNSLGTCPSCGNPVNEVSLVTKEGLSAAASEAAKLLDVLKLDFGFRTTEMQLSFSGHRGFHVLITSEKIRDLSPRERVEIVDYLTLQGFSARWGGQRLLREVERGRVSDKEKGEIEGAAVKIDPVVTIDVHRLLRAPMSLHGKTGLSKLPLDDPEKFTDLSVASLIPSDEKVKVRVIRTPKIEFAGGIFGPFKNDVVDVPLNVAVLFLCLGVAVIV